LPALQDAGALGRADSEEQITETEEDNNPAISSRIFFGTPSYDLEILDVAYDASSPVSPGSALPVSVTVKNHPARTRRSVLHRGHRRLGDELSGNGRIQQYERRYRGTSRRSLTACARSLSDSERRSATPKERLSFDQPG
jgi:hypothetical protein